MTTTLGRALRAGLLAAGLVLAVAPATSGCKAMAEGLQDAMGVSEDIKNEFGVQASVHIGVSNGKHTVTVTFSETPTGDAKDVKAKVEKIVKKRLPDTDEVIIKM